MYAAPTNVRVVWGSGVVLLSRKDLWFGEGKQTRSEPLTKGDGMRQRVFTAAERNGDRPRKVVRFTPHVLRILGLLDGARRPRHGYALMRATRLPAGTIFPLMDRLVEIEFVRRHQETGSRQKLGRGLRTYYVITDLGRTMYRQATDIVRLKGERRILRISA